MEDLTNWNTAIEIFFAGIAIVMFVMFLLQISVSLTAKVVKLIENSGAKVAEQKNEKA